MYFNKMLLTLATMLIATCGTKDKDSEPKRTEIELQDLYGTWSITGASLEESDTQPVMTGDVKFVFRKNGTYFRYGQASSFSFSGYTGNANCTFYSGGKFNLSGSKITMTDSYIAAISGTCDTSVTAPYVSTSQDSSFTISTDGKSLFLISPISTSSGTNNLTFSLESVAKEIWSGSGVDSRFNGKWKQSKGYSITFCGDKLLSKGLLTMSGSETYTVADNAYTHERSEFAYSSNAKCTGVAKGTIALDGLKLSLKQTEANADCIKQNSDTTVANLFQSDIVTQSNQWVTISAFTYKDASCTSEIEYHEVAIAEKQ